MLSKADVVKLEMTPPKDGSARLFPLQKTILCTDSGDICLAITVQRRVPELCLRLPDDRIRYLGGIDNIEQAEAFIDSITDFDGNY